MALSSRAKGKFNGSDDNSNANGAKKRKRISLFNAENAKKEGLTQRCKGAKTQSAERRRQQRLSAIRCLRSAVRGLPSAVRCPY
jgi:hypothetical protein